MLQQRETEDFDILEAVLADSQELPVEALERLQRTDFRRHDRCVSSAS